MRQHAKSGRKIPLSSALTILSDIGWFGQRSQKTRELLSGIARLRVFEPGSALYAVGDAPNGVFGLVDGELDISIPRADGNDFTFHTADRGFWVGDLALMSSAKRLVSITAATEATVVHLDAADLSQLVQAEPALLHDFYALTYENFATTFFLLANISIASSESRVALRLLVQIEQAPDGDGWVHLSQAKLGELVALSQPTLQRVLKRLQELGCVELGYGRIRIADRAKLRALCGENAVLYPQAEPAG